MNLTESKTDATSLEVLRGLTRALTLKDFVRGRGTDWVRYEMLRGTCIGVSLLHERAIAVQKTFMSKYSVFPLHLHEEIEILVIYEGGIETLGKVFKAGDIARIENGEEHTVTALEDTWMVAITIPASSAYPESEEYGSQ